MNDFQQYAILFRLIFAEQGNQHHLAKLREAEDLPVHEDILKLHNYDWDLDIESGATSHLSSQSQTSGNKNG